MTASRQSPVPVAVVGASGYSGVELIRLLLRHERAELRCLTSRRFAGRSLSSVHPRFQGAGIAGALTFDEADPEIVVRSGAQAVFLALPHGVSAEYARPLLDAGLRVIDLSDDFRLRDPGVYEAFRGRKHPAPDLLPSAVYGLPEFHAQEIREARLVASPGCYPTSVLIPLIPLLQADCIDPTSICAFSLSGVSGAGRKAEIPLLFVECNESLRAYGAPQHRHLAEIEQELSWAARRPVIVSFTPHLVPVTAGIATTIYANPTPGLPPDRIAQVYSEAYKTQPFVRVLGENVFPDSKHVTGTNFIDLGWVQDLRAGRLVLCSSEDNLGKGAAGQAVQCLNVMFGLPETAGLLGI
ncbi:MAG TPA: N-acetyl-gamma-glutamyl-phosphate reductase [Verrucomicrobiales bacterium]|nr:N-acetyl-gamma-glutamyl-phosphate reductase [Verrucomicrobiales bacterium]